MKRIHADQRRNKILSVAGKLFSRSGFRGTATSTIAAKAKISEALLFKHFPSKAELFAAIMHQKLAERTPALFDKLPIESGPQVLLHEVAWRLYSMHEKDPSFLRLLHYSVLEERKLVDLFFNERSRPLCDFLIDYLSKQKQQGRIKKLDVHKTVMAYLCLVNGFATSKLLFAVPELEKFATRPLLRSYVDAFLTGILP